LDLIIDSKHDELQIEELEIPADSSFVGHKVSEQFANKRGSVALLAMRRDGSKSFLRPTSTTVIEVGDKLILMGTTSQLDTLLERG